MNIKKFTLSDQQLLEEIMLHRRDIRGNNFLQKDISEDTSDIKYKNSLLKTYFFDLMKP